MKANERIRCPKCGEETVVHERIIFDGWTRKGSVFECSFCHAELDRPEPAPQTAPGNNAPAPTPTRAGKLAALLGESTPDATAAPQILGDAAQNHFCRDCAHYLTHTFLSRCFLTGREVNPMDDCERFEPKKAAKS